MENPGHFWVEINTFQTDFRCISGDEDGPPVKPFLWPPMEVPQRKGTG